MSDWAKELKVSITVTDREGNIIEMNDASKEVFQKYGGSALLGRSVFDCHSSASREKIADLIANWETNCYTMERNGIKKLIYQTPWYQDGKACGLVELSMEIPFDIPHRVRK